MTLIQDKGVARQNQNSEFSISTYSFLFTSLDNINLPIMLKISCYIIQTSLCDVYVSGFTNKHIIR